jgi:hypothetical protein
MFVALANTRPLVLVPRYLAFLWMVFIYQFYQTFDLDQSFDAIRHRIIPCTTRMLVLAKST